MEGWNELERQLKCFIAKPSYTLTMEAKDQGPIKKKKSWLNEDNSTYVCKLLKWKTHIDKCLVVF